MTHGTNRVIGSSLAKIISKASKVFDTPLHLPVLPPLWDGQAGERIVQVLVEQLEKGEAK